LHFMKELFFWRAWPAAERRIAHWALGILSLSLLFFVATILDPLGNVVHWDVLSELSEIPSVVDILPLDGWQFGVTIPSYLTMEQFSAAPMELPVNLIRFGGILALLGLCVILAALTALPRFWYLASMVAFILLTAACRLETLGLFGEGSRLLFLIVVGTYGGLSYYLHAFRPDWNIRVRMLAFIGLTALMALVVTLASPVTEPMLTFAAFSYPLWLTLSIVFLLLSATEIMAGLVWLSTNGRKGKSLLTNFLIISSFYLLTLLLLYLKNTQRIEWNSFMVSPVVLALAAGLLGIWGFRRRMHAASSDTLNFRAVGFWLYVGLFTTALAFGGYVAATANDPVLEVLEDIIVEGQLAMSALFFFYILANFLPLFQQGLAVHKVLYKPLKFGLMQTRLLGFGGLILLIATQEMLPLYQSAAGYFNGLGDLYTKTKEYTLAEQYYKFALQQEFQNHKSNYGLASLALRQDDKTAAAYYFKQATLKNPSAQAYVGLGGVLSQESLFFDAVASYQEGLQRFPGSSELLNNLGLLYARTNVADSAYYYLDRAERANRSDNIPPTNLLALYAKNTDTELLDSLAKSAADRAYYPWQANWLAVQNLRQQFDKQTFATKAIRKDSLLNVSGLAYLVNYSLNQARHDSTPVRLIARLADKNPLLADDLLLPSLYADFYAGNRQRAVESMQVLAENGGEKAALYRKILGHWLLQLGLYAQAAEQFGLVDGPEGLIGQILANAFSGNEAVAGVLVEGLPARGAEAAMPTLRKTLASGFRPRILGDSSLQAAQANPSVAAYQKAWRDNPFHGRTVAAVAEYFRQHKLSPRAYELVVNALQFNETAPLLWEQYAYLSVEKGLLAQGDEAADRVQQLTSDADYQAFLNRYQPMRALIEKRRAEF
jgi:Flp pilus assembly protein TadD